MNEMVSQRHKMKVSRRRTLQEQQQLLQTVTTNEKYMARAAIIYTIESEYIPMVAIQQGPGKIWRKLANANKSKCVASVHTLRRRLMNMEMGKAATVREFVNEICAIERNWLYLGQLSNKTTNRMHCLMGYGKNSKSRTTILQENYGMNF